MTRARGRAVAALGVVAVLASAAVISRDVWLTRESPGGEAIARRYRRAPGLVIEPRAVLGGPPVELRPVSLGGHGEPEPVGVVLEALPTWFEEAEDWSSWPGPGSSTRPLVQAITMDLHAVARKPRRDAFSKLTADMEDGTYVRPYDVLKSALVVDKQFVLKWVQSESMSFQAGYSLTYLSSDSGAFRDVSRAFLSHGIVAGLGADF